MGKTWIVQRDAINDCVVIETTENEQAVYIPMIEVIPFVKAVFTAATGREFTGEETRWNTPDAGGDDGDE